VTVVVDSSVAACWAMPDEFSATANRVLEMLEHGEIVVPGLFPYELRNVLITNERRGRIDARRTHEALAWIRTLPFRVVADFREAELLALARRHRLTIYDAAYLDLALAEGLAIATLDQRLASAARAEGLAAISEA